MSATFEDLRILKSAEQISDSIWQRVIQWDDFQRDVVGKQIARAADSVGANIAESFGRYNFGEKLQFLYYARGSLFETKYWLNRSQARGLIAADEARMTVEGLIELARQLNAFTRGLRTVRAGQKTTASAVRDDQAAYSTNGPKDPPDPLFSEDELNWLTT